MKSIKQTIFLTVFILMALFVIIHNVFLQKNPAETSGAIPAPEITLGDGRYCFNYNNTESDAPYKVSEDIDMNIQGSAVVGTKSGTQNGPGMTNGYFGALSGTKEGTTINAVFSYTVEGSQNKEREVYTITETGLNKLRYPLLETPEGLEPDMTKEFTAIAYTQTECSAILDPLAIN